MGSCISSQHIRVGVSDPPTSDVSPYNVLGAKARSDHHKQAPSLSTTIDSATDSAKSVSSKERLKDTTKKGAWTEEEPLTFTPISDPRHELLFVVDCGVNSTTSHSSYDSLDFGVPEPAGGFGALRNDFGLPPLADLLRSRDSTDEMQLSLLSSEASVVSLPSPSVPYH